MRNGARLCGFGKVAALLWGGHDECLQCVANKVTTPDLCHDLQERGLCGALDAYPGRLIEAIVPQSDAGTTVRIQLEHCQGELDNENWCTDLLKDLCRHIGMNLLAGPLTESLHHPTDPTKSGVSSVLIIQESHIAIHTWPKENAVRAVIDTCKDGLPIGHTAAWLLKRVGARISRVFVSRLYEQTIFK